MRGVGGDRVWVVTVVQIVRLCGCKGTHGVSLCVCAGYVC